MNLILFTTFHGAADYEVCLESANACNSTIQLRCYTIGFIFRNQADVSAQGIMISPNP
ncbi:MAG: hypothetical protein IPH88_17090 [Bacteroidales bacterium]|nr:hypothetical protein [Bacteroidales bacterium]